MVVYEDGDCIVIETNLGLVLAEWYGGSAHQGQQVVGDLHSYGLKEIYTPSGSALRVYIDDFWVDEDEAREWLAENGCQ